MRKITAILLAVLLFVAGMHFTIAAHFCNEKLYKTHLSVDGKLATCGMEKFNFPPNEVLLTIDCCEDDVTVYSIEDNYTCSVFSFSIIPFALENFLPEGFFIRDQHSSSYGFLSDSPPGELYMSPLSPDIICTFRI